MTSKVYTAKEVASHNRENDLWIVMNRKVYDVSLFAKDHPGGEEVLLDVAGKDATACFDDIGHSVSAILAREKYNIGELGSTEIIGTNLIATGSIVFFFFSHINRPHRYNLRDKPL